MTASRDIDGTLAELVALLPDGGEERPGQVEMAKAVELAIASKQHLAVQAGTGTGKTLAYLVPSILMSHSVVVATATTTKCDMMARWQERGHLSATA